MEAEEEDEDGCGKNSKEQEAVADSLLFLYPSEKGDGSHSEKGAHHEETDAPGFHEQRQISVMCNVLSFCQIAVRIPVSGIGQRAPD